MGFDALRESNRSGPMVHHFNSRSVPTSHLFTSLVTCASVTDYDKGQTTMRQLFSYLTKSRTFHSGLLDKITYFLEKQTGPYEKKREGVKGCPATLEMLLQLGSRWKTAADRRRQK